LLAPKDVFLAIFWALLFGSFPLKIQFGKTFLTVDKGGFLKKSKNDEKKLINNK